LSFHTLRETFLFKDPINSQFTLNVIMKASFVAAAGIFSTTLAGPLIEKRADTISNSKTPPVSVKGNGQWPYHSFSQRRL
jgi:hypothetical protein